MLIGVTGNTSTGKTVICELYEKLGAHIISCDELGWAILRESHILEKLKDEFEEVIENGKVDREKLGNLVFSNKNKLKILNEIVHPELLKKLKSLIGSSKEKTIVVDAALIFEWKIENWFDYIILLISTQKDKESRLKAKGLSEKTINGRLISQEDSNRFIKYSDFIIENDGDLDSLKNNAKWVWDEIKKGKKS